MHALVGVWSLAPGGGDGLDSHARLGAAITHLPGFVQAFWSLDAETGKVHSFDVFEDEGAVLRLRDLLEAKSGAQARAGLSYDRLSIVEVKAWARATDSPVKAEAGS